MGGVADFAGDIVGGAVDVVGDVVGGVGDLAGDAVEFVADSVSDTVESVTTITEAFLDDPLEFTEAVIDNALENPIETAAVVAAAYYAPQLVAEMAPGLSATATNIAADVGVGATKALLEGESVGESIIGDLIGAGLSTGFTEAKDLIKEAVTNIPSLDLVDEIAETDALDNIPLDTKELSDIIGDQAGDFPLEGSFGDALAPGVKDAVQELLDANVITNQQAQDFIADAIAQEPVPVEVPTEPAGIETLPQEVPVQEVIGDQPGDFPLEGSFGEPLAPEVKEAVQELLDTNAITADQVEEVFERPIEEVIAEPIPEPELEVSEEPAGLETLPAIGDQPEDFPIEGSFGTPTAPGVKEAVQDLLDYNAGIATQLPEVIGDQPGDYPLNQEELDLAAKELEDIPFGSLGDQPGDYPLTQEDLELEDALMGQIGDQPGDYPTEGSYGDPLAPGVKDAVQDLLDYNAAYAGGVGSGGGQGSQGGGGSGGITQTGAGINPLLLAGLLGAALGTADQAKGQRVGFFGQVPEYLATRIPGRGVQYSLANPPITAAEGGLMSIYPPGESVLRMASGGIAASMAAEMGKGPGYKSMQEMLEAGKGATTEEANALAYLIGRGMSPKEARSVVEQGGNVYSFAGGGISDLGSYTHAKGGRMLKGPGDGMSDSIPATIEGKRPARLATDEFVVPADVVSHLGNGSSDAGAKVLYDMMDRVRKARTGTTKQGKEINPKKFLPK